MEDIDIKNINIKKYMKNSKIHEGLENKEIRDFLSLSLVKLFDRECNNKKEIIPYDKENPFETLIKNDEEQVKLLLKNIDINKEKLAIIKLIKNNGWEEFDISDYTQNDTGYRLWMSFIGTKEEYEKFMEQIEK